MFIDKTKVKMYFNTMNIRAISVMVLFTALMLFSCGGGGGNGSKGNADKSVSKWTVLVYMDADNSLDDVAKYNIKQMEEVGSGKNLNVIVQLDTIDNTTRRLFIEKGHVKLIEDLGEQDMANGSTLVSFLEWSIKNFPADHYFLILWDHGGGFKNLNKRGIFQDTTSNTIMSIKTLQDAINKAITKTKQHFDIIGFDDCLMGMLEIAYEIKNEGDIMIASESTEPVNGWNYTYILDNISRSPNISPYTLARSVVDDYYQNYSDRMVDLTLSAIKLGEIDNLSRAIYELSNNLLVNIENDNITIYNTINNILDNVTRVDENGNGIIDSNDSYIDLLSFLNLVANNGNLPVSLRNIAKKGEDLYNKAVFASVSSGNLAKGCNGMSIWFPDSSAYAAYSSLYSTLKFVSDNSSWISFIKSFVE